MEKIRVNKKFLFSILFLTFLTFTFIASNNGNDYFCKSDISDVQVLSTSPFNITHNDNFTLYAASGDGSKSTPWIIENLNISTTSSYAIYVINTTDYFTIRNCTIKNNYTYGNGIQLRNVTNGLILNNTINECDDGVYIYYSDNNTFLNNRINPPTDSFQDAGFSVYKSNNNSFINNTVDDYYNGISMQYSTECNLVNNKFLSGKLGIHGTNLSHYMHDVYVNNTIDGIPIIFLKNISNYAISGNFAQIYIVNCSKINMIDYNLIENTWGINVLFTNSCYFFNNSLKDSFYLTNSTNNTIYKNVINGPLISLDRSNLNNISTNTMYFYRDAIKLRYSNNNTIDNNYLVGVTSGYTFKGIELSSSNFNNITRNYVKHAVQSATVIGMNGLELVSSSFNYIYDNDFLHADESGIALSYSHNNSIISNTANYNGQRGIDLEYSDNNSILYNVFNYNTWYAAVLYNSSYNNITGNTMHGSYFGLKISDSVGNIVVDNDIQNISFFGNFLDIIIILIIISVITVPVIIAVSFFRKYR